MNAKDIMSAPVITISLITPVVEIRTLLLERNISGVPVLHEDGVVGIVSESDLLHRYEAGAHAAPARSWWRRWVQPSAAPRDYVRSHGSRAADVMSRDLVSVGEEMSIAEVASLMTRRRIHRVPVLRDNRLVGIVTGSDLMKVMPASAPAMGSATWSDADVEQRLSAELAAQDWWNPLWSQVTVHDGIACFCGMIENEAQREACRVAAENTPGVCGVVDDRIRAADWQAMA